MNDAYTDEQLTETVDNVLKMMDNNHDGFITYSEYRRSR